MSALLQSSVSNKLLALMAPTDFVRLRQVMQPVTLDQRMILIQPHKPISHVYFVEEGIVSQIAITERGRAEAGLYGREGFSGSPLLLDVDQTPYEHSVQVAGHGFASKPPSFLNAVEQSPPLQRLLLRFAHVLGMQVAYSVFANSNCSIVARLARWILMYEDRVGGDGMFLTHAFLASMLGIRRAGVTDSLHILEGARAIKSTRGHLRVVDRDKLIAAAECYGIPESEYDRLIGTWRDVETKEDLAAAA